jgi:uncharacterized protein YqiB (DUF1249 family)
MSNTKANKLKELREIMAVYSENYRKLINTLWEKYRAF